jgi:hypothetical protein
MKHRSTQESPQSDSGSFVLSSTLLVPFIAPAILFLSGEKENVEAVLLWPIINWFVCLLLRYFRFPKVPIEGRIAIIKRKIHSYAILIFFAMSFVALFEAGMAVCIQASDTPPFAWVIVFAVFYLPHITLVLLSERTLGQIKDAVRNDRKITCFNSGTRA